MEPLARSKTTHMGLAASTLLAAAGVLAIAAAAQRWWSACEIGAFDTSSCLRLQDNAYNYTVPSDSWVPVGSAAELQGVAMLFLAIAVLLLPAALTGRRPRLVLSIAAVVVSVGIAVSAAVTWLSGYAGQVVTMPGMWLPVMLWWLGLPALVGASFAFASVGPVPVRVGVQRWAVVACVLASTPPVTQLFVAPMLSFYQSHDMIPWSEAVGGMLLIGASVFLALASYRHPLPDAASADAFVTQQARWT